MEHRDDLDEPEIWQALEAVDEWAEWLTRIVTNSLSAVAVEKETKKLYMKPVLPVAPVRRAVLQIENSGFLLVRIIPSPPS